MRFTNDENHEKTFFLLKENKIREVRKSFQEQAEGAKSIRFKHRNSHR